MLSILDMFTRKELQMRDLQLHRDTDRATEIYNKSGKVSLEMSNMVDFSNPASVFRVQNPTIIANPYGTNNPYKNPNIIQQNPNINMNSYNQPIYGTWYGNMTFAGVPSLSQNIVSTLVDNKTGQQFNVTIAKYEEEPFNITEQHQSYIDKITGKGLEVKIVKSAPDVTEHNGHKIYKTKEGIHYFIVKDDYKHEKGKPFTKEELCRDKKEIRLIYDIPLVWTEEDEKELSNLYHALRPYDQAMAYVIWEIPTYENAFSREEYIFSKIYARKLLEEYKRLEMTRKDIDFRASYQYRELPDTIKNPETGELEIDRNSKTHKFAYVNTDIYGRKTYRYDRGRYHLTHEEWELFLDKAYIELIEAIDELRQQQIFDLNKKEFLSDQEAKKEEEIAFNPNDPISINLYWKKQAEKFANMNKNVFKFILRHRMDEEEFDNWWYGGKKLKTDEEYRQDYMKMWNQRAFEQRLAELDRRTPLDPVLYAQIGNAKMYEAIQRFTLGSEKKCKNIAELVDNLDYLCSRIDQMKLEDEMKITMSNLNKNPFFGQFKNNIDPNGVLDCLQGWMKNLGVDPLYIPKKAWKNKETGTYEFGYEHPELIQDFLEKKRKFDVACSKLGTHFPLG